MTEQQPGAPRPHDDETSPLAAQPAATTATDGPHPPPPPHAGPQGEPPAPPRGTRLRDRARRIPRAAWLSATAVIVVVGIGLGGFLLGRTTAPDGGGRGHLEHGQRPGFPGGPGDGQMPGMPGQGQGAPGQQGAPSSDGDGATDDSADTTSSYVVPPAS